MTNEDEGGAHRLDKWLWHARFYKTRALAGAAIQGGKVHLNGERVKPAHRTRIGDLITMSFDGVTGEFEILGLPVRRGPAPEARGHYAETPASVARRSVLREQRRLADLTRPRPDTRPDKRDRRRLMKLHREQS